MRRAFVYITMLCSLSVAAQDKKIKLSDIWKNNTFRMKSVPGFNAMKDGEHYTQIDVAAGSKQSINQYELASGNKTATILDAASFAIPDSLGSIANYEFSDDEQKMLLFFKSENIYRRSVLNYVMVADLRTKQLTLLDKQKVLHPSFSPDANSIAYVKENNLFLYDIKTSKSTAITKDGKRNEIINGNCDWVYEEEFSFTKAYQWSPDGQYIAYYRFDERNVPQYTMTIYDNLYPTPYTYKYPKAGDNNSVIQIKYYHLPSRKTTNANIGTETDIYIPRILWTQQKDQLCILRLNRLQNKLEYLISNAANGNSRVLYTDNNQYYVEIEDNITFLSGKEQAFIFASEKDGYMHLYHYNEANKKETLLTPGSFDVANIVSINEKEQKIWYMAAEQTATERKLYSVNLDGSNKSCLTAENGTHSITPIAGDKYFLDKYSTLTQPPVFSLRNAIGQTVRVLENNAALAEKLKEYKLGKLQLLQINGANNQPLNAWMITPPDFDSAKKYPVLMFQYSGPNSQQVADRFPVADYYWHEMLAQKGYIIVCADGTGTGFRGEAFRKKTYLQLGRYESDDQIAVAKNIGNWPFVDKERIGIWGWSFGGFMSTTCLLKGNDVFKMAIAVAPVTNWRYYDNIYTERYMRKPQDNAAGYDENSPVQMASKLKGNYLLIHGTGDDNVHVQNAFSLIDALITNNKEYDSEVYPNRNHGIGGGNTRYHLYRRMTDYILEHL